MMMMAVLTMMTVTPGPLVAGELGGHLGRSRYVLEHLDELLGGLAGDGLDVALEDEEVAGLDEDADLPEGILFWFGFGLFV